MTETEIAAQSPARRALARKMRQMSKAERLRYLGCLHIIWRWRRQMETRTNEQN